MDLGSRQIVGLGGYPQDAMLEYVLVGGYRVGLESEAPLDARLL